MPRPRLSRKAKDPNVPTNAPILSLVTALGLIGAGVVIVVTGHGGENDGSLLVGLVVTTIPSIIAAAFAERASRDVRNGTVTEKARLGAHKAIQEAGVITKDGATVQAALSAQAASMGALTAVLERVAPELVHNTDLTETIADALDVPHEDFRRQETRRPKEGTQP